MLTKKTPVMLVNDMSKTRVFMGMITIFFLAVFMLSAVSVAQVATLTNTLNINNLGITVGYPGGWSVVPKRYANMDELINVPANQQSVVGETARIKIRIQARTDHNEAVSELREIAAEVRSPSTFLAIGGWPGLLRRDVEQRQQPSKGPRHIDERMLRITTAVAAGNMLARLDAFLPSDASQELIEEAEAIGLSLTFTTTGDPVQVQQELENLRSSRGRRGSIWGPLPLEGIPTGAETFHLSGEGSLEGSPGFTQRLFTLNNGELEIAVSPNGQTIVVARQNNWRTSNNGGQTFPFSGNINLGDGDPSLAYGQSGNFYLAGISINCLPADINGPFGYDCTGILRSTDNGHTFPFLSNAVRCPKDDPNAPPNPHLATRCFPDQEHIAADRFNAAPGGDQVYSVWRNFDATDQDPAIVCSQDSGVNWTAPVDVDSGFIPRVGVGQNGFVYVVYRSGGNIRINKYSSCANGLVVQPTFPKTIAAVNDVTCPVPGLDRCNDGNNLSSIMVAVDDTNPNHVYVAYAHETAAGNQNILVRDSLDGGVTWPGPRVVTVNSGVSGVRFMPWICTTGGDAFVTWYDRRAATPCPVPPCPANNDLTDYYAGRVGLDGSGTLTPGGEFKITGASDPQCASGWPCAPRATGDSESCSVQPQLAGVCCVDNGSGGCLPGGSGQRCDFLGPDATACPGAETCHRGGGCPKYGDYNGNACAAGRLLTAWASATPPPGITPSGGIDIFFAQFLVGDVPQIQVPGGTAFADTCVGGTAFSTLDVCNTGNANLEVASITSSNSQFSVTTPSSGYPVVISPDFCFPFQVRFIPTSTGNKSATLTIPTNDPANPSITVQATGNGVERKITVTGSTKFGDVCPGGVAEKTVSVCNTGACDLHVSGASFVPPCPDFVFINNPFPATVSPDSCLDLVIQFTPTSAGPKSCNLVVTSDDPNTPSIPLTVTANTLAAGIDVAGNLPFPPTVIQSIGACSAQNPFPISNTGTCNLTITNIVIGGPDGSDYSLSGLPSFPIILEPGHVVGEGDLKAVFKPTALDRDRIGSLTVTYISNPITGATTNVQRALCGEGVRTGARVLVSVGGAPVENVERIHLQRINGNRNKNILDTVDNAKDLPLQSVTPAAPCAPFQYHREYGTVSNPIQLLPGSYQVTATVRINGKRTSKTVGFDVNTCGFNPNILINF